MSKAVSELRRAMNEVGMAEFRANRDAPVCPECRKRQTLGIERAERTLIEAVRAHLPGLLDAMYDDGEREGAGR